MCGIVGYIGQNDAKEILLKGLEKLEYRGYDSAGIAVANDEGEHVFKEKSLMQTWHLQQELDIHAGQLTVYQAI